MLLGLFVLEEHVVKRAVDDRVEPILQALEFGRVGNLEVHRHPGALGVGLRALDRRRRAVDPGGGVTLRCVVDRVMAGAGAGVKDLTPHRPVGHQLLHHRLGSADVPRCQRRQPVN